jgi:hypothetical protein
MTRTKLGDSCERAYSVLKVRGYGVFEGQVKGYEHIRGVFGSVSSLPMISKQGMCACNFSSHSLYLRSLRSSRPASIPILRRSDLWLTLLIAAQRRSRHESGKKPMPGSPWPVRIRDEAVTTRWRRQPQQHPCDPAAFATPSPNSSTPPPPPSRTARNPWAVTPSNPGTQTTVPSYHSRPHTAGTESSRARRGRGRCVRRRTR